MELSQIYLFHLLHLFQVKTWFQNRRAKWRRLKQVSRLTWTNIFNVNGHGCNKQVYSLFIFKKCKMLRSRILVLVLTDNTLFSHRNLQLERNRVNPRKTKPEVTSPKIPRKETDVPRTRKILIWRTVMMK